MEEQQEKHQFEDLICKAKLADKVDRHEDVVKVLKQLVDLNLTDQLSKEDRTLLADAYRHIVGKLRKGWRTVIIEGKNAPDELKRKVAVEYRKEIEKELKDTCREIIDMVNGHFLPKAKKADPEAKVFYLKIRGDYYRYMCEISESEERQDVEERSRKAYEEGYALAKNQLPKANPGRLGIALNYSVFLFEIADDLRKAIDLANQAYQVGIAEIDQLSEADYKDASLILYFIRENLKVWKDEKQSPRDEPISTDEATAVSIGEP